MRRSLPPISDEKSEALRPATERHHLRPLPARRYLTVQWLRRMIFA